MKTKSQNLKEHTLTTSTTSHPFKSAYGQKIKSQILFEGPGRTKQSFRDECDINIIMGRYLKTGHIEHVNQTLPQFTDMTGLDYTESMQIVAESKSLFLELPSNIRAKFENNPAKFLDFVHNPENRSEMAEMGLLRPGADLGTHPSQTAAGTQPTPQAATPAPIPTPAATPAKP